MSLQDPYLINTDMDVHLRDARHAHQLYTQHNFALAPKTKFLFHVVFDLYDEVGDQTTSNTAKFRKEIGVLAKSASLPNYRVSVENKQQYNRKKNIQTRIDYSDCTLTFHDDNLGLTRGLLEDYYKYYFVDGNHSDESGVSSGAPAYQARDKYKSAVPSYGLNNGKTNPFFKSIRIYQLARREWFAYTLVNPLVSAFDHGDVDATTGGDFNSNTMTIAYESVIYSNGKVKGAAKPTGFTDEETAYDNHPSALTYNDPAMEYKYGAADPVLLGNRQRNRFNPVQPRSSNNNSKRDSIFGNISGGNILGAGLRDLNNSNTPGGLRGVNIPRSNSTTSSQLVSGQGRVLDGDTIVNGLSNNPSAKASFVARALNSNAQQGESLASYNSASATKQAAIETSLINKAASGDRKLAGQATDAIDAFKGRII